MAGPSGYGALLSMSVNSLAPDTMRLVLDTMAEGVVLHDADGAVVWCNPSAARILGSSVLLPVGSGIHESPWLAIREDGTEFPWSEHPAMVALGSGRPQHDVVMGIERPDG